MIEKEYILCPAGLMRVFPVDPIYHNKDVFKLECGVTKEEIEKRCGENIYKYGWMTSKGMFVENESLRIPFNGEWLIGCAIKLKDSEEFRIGLHHCDILIKYQGLVSKLPSRQGFVTNTGRWVDRDESVRIAVAAGQCDKKDIWSSVGLFSEDMWL